MAATGAIGTLFGVVVQRKSGPRAVRATYPDGRADGEAN
jgi:hypothetical protein